MKKYLAPCALLLALATATVTTATAAHAAEQPFQAGRCASPVALQTGDPSLDQLASDAQAVWHELSPEVREMVDELMASRGLDAPDAARLCMTAALAMPEALPAHGQPCKALQTQPNGNNVTLGLRCASARPATAKAG